MSNPSPAEVPNNPRSTGEVALLSLIAAFNPSLLAATTVMLLLPRPERLMFGYWLGAMLMGIVSGLVIVFALSGMSTGQATKKSVIPAVFKARRTKRKNGNKTPKWQQKMREGTARTTFVIGIALSLPGVSYLAALDRLHKLHYSTVVTVRS